MYCHQSIIVLNLWDYVVVLRATVLADCRDQLLHMLHVQESCGQHVVGIWNWIVAVSHFIRLDDGWRFDSHRYEVTGGLIGQFIALLPTRRVIMLKNNQSTMDGRKRKRVKPIHLMRWNYCEKNLNLN